MVLNLSSNVRNQVRSSGRLPGSDVRTPLSTDAGRCLAHGMPINPGMIGLLDLSPLEALPTADVAEGPMRSPRAFLVLHRKSIPVTTLTEKPLACRNPSPVTQRPRLTNVRLSPADNSHHPAKGLDCVCTLRSTLQAMASPRTKRIISSAGAPSTLPEACLYSGGGSSGVTAAWC